MKLKIIFLFTVALFTSFTTKGRALKVQASSADTAGDFVYTNKTNLGIDTDLHFDFDDTVSNDQSEFEYDGLIYKRGNTYTGTLNEIILPEFPADIITLGLHEKIGKTTFYSHKLYESIDFSKFIHAKNLIIDYSISLNLSAKLALLPEVENVYILKTAQPPYKLNLPKLKNVILTHGASYGNMNWNQKSDFNIETGYPKDVKFVTSESFKYVYHFYLRTYLKSVNYKGIEDLKVYVIPDEELIVPLDKMLVPNKYHPVAYKEYAGVKYLPYRYSSLNPDLFKYTFGYIDPLITKTVYNPGVFDKYNHIIDVPKHKLDTLYALEGSTDEIYQIKAENLVIDMPAVFSYKNYLNYKNVYFYPTANVTSLTIDDVSIAGDAEVNVNFYTLETTVKNFTCANQNIESKFYYFNNDILPMITIKSGKHEVSTRDLNKPLDELKAELAELIENSQDDEPPEEENPDDENPGEPDDHEKNKNKKIDLIETGISVMLVTFALYIIYVSGRKISQWLKK